MIFSILAVANVSGCITGSDSSFGKIIPGEIDQGSSLKSFKDSMIIGTIGTIGDIDPGSNPNSFWNYLVTESMIEVDPYGNLIPGLARSWENTNGTSWIFHLRDDVRFHDGKKMTAYDVKYSLERSMSKSASNKKYFNIKECIVLDDHTINLITEKPDASIPGRMSGPRSVIYSNTSGMNDKGVIIKPVGTGPFMFVSMDMATDVIELKKFDGYYNGTARLARITIKYGMDDPNTREMAIEKGEIDFTIEPSLASTNRLRKNPDLNVYVYDWHGSYKMKPGNVTKEPYNDVRVRKALAYAIDREKIVKSILIDRGTVSKGNGVPYMMPWYNDEIQGYSYDPQKARSLLKDAGWIDNDGDGILDKNGRQFRMTLYASGGNPAIPQMAPAIQSQLRDIGISADIQILDSTAINARDQEWGFLYLSYDVPMFICDPHYYPESNFMTGGASNTFKYSNPDVDRLLLDARSEFDVTKRYEIYKKVQKIVVDDDCVQINFANQRYSVVTRQDLKGYVPNVVTHNWRINRDMHFE